MTVPWSGKSSCYFVHTSNLYCETQLSDRCKRTLCSIGGGEKPITVTINREARYDFNVRLPAPPADASTCPVDRVLGKATA
jgi:hypothetical protein